MRHLHTKFLGASLLADGGVHPKVAQTLARHASITITMKEYTHLDVLDVLGALDKLPAAPRTNRKPSRRPPTKKRRQA